MQIPQVSEDNKTLISFDKHLDKSVISQLVVTSNDLENYQKVQTKTEEILLRIIWSILVAYNVRSNIVHGKNTKKMVPE